MMNCNNTLFATDLISPCFLEWLFPSQIKYHTKHNKINITFHNNWYDIANHLMNFTWIFLTLWQIKNDPLNSKWNKKKINMAGCVSVFQIMKLDNQFRNRSLPYHRNFKVLLIFVKPHIFVMYQVVFFFFCFFYLSLHSYQTKIIRSIWILSLHLPRQNKDFLNFTFLYLYMYICMYC